MIDVDSIPYFPIFAGRIVCGLRRKRMVATWHEVWGKEYWQSYLGGFALISAVTERLAAHMPAKIVAYSQQTTNRLVG